MSRYSPFQRGARLWTKASDSSSMPRCTIFFDVRIDTGRERGLTVPTALPVHSKERVCFRFHKMLPEFVWDASVLEGNPFTFPEVKTLLDGIIVGGRQLSDQEQILNLAEASKRLLALVRAGEFALSKSRFAELRC